MASEVETDQFDSSAMSLEANLMSGEVACSFILVKSGVAGCIDFIS